MKFPVSRLFAVAAMVAAAGCSTVNVPIAVMRPAEIDLTGYKQVAVGDFRGNAGQHFSDRVKEGLVNSPSGFQVLDRSRLNQILKELKLSQTDLVDPRYRARTGRLLGATVLVTGNIHNNYKEDTRQERGECKSRERGKYTCWSNIRSGMMTTSGSVDVIDLQTGQILKTKGLSNTCGLTNEAVDSSPARIDVNALADQCVSKSAGDFLRTVSVWREVVNIAYEKDSALPEMERGILLAKTGDLAQAENVFASVARASEKSASVGGKSIATAYWNLGQTQLYMRQYDKAISSFDKAFALNADEKYLREKQRAETMRREERRIGYQINSR